MDEQNELAGGVDRGRMMWELPARSYWVKMSRRLLGASNRVVGVAVQGDLGWWKLEGRSEDNVQ